MNTLFTISTSSHLFKSFALRDSLALFGYDLLILLVDGVSDKQEGNIISLQNIQAKEPLFEAVNRRYKKGSDAFRWALKPVMAKYLLENGYEQVIYVDNDIYFFNSPEFLFEKLNQSDFLLTPHFYPLDTQKNQNWLEANFRVGLYNAGFFGANKNAIPILDWWAKCCLYEVRKSYWRGLYDDQKYLDLVPVIFDNVEVLKDRTCNFAGWNCDEVTFEQKENKHLINGNLLVFVHFAQLTMERFSDESSPYIILYKEYIEAVQKYQPNFLFKGKKISRLALRNYWYYLRWKIASR